MKAPLVAVATLGVAVMAAVMPSSLARAQGKVVPCRCDAVYASCMRMQPRRRDAFQERNCRSRQADCRRRCSNPLIFHSAEKIRRAPPSSAVW